MSTNPHLAGFWRRSAAPASPDPDSAVRDAIIAEWTRLAPDVVRADALARYAATQPGVRESADPVTQVTLKWWEKYESDLAAAQALFEAVRDGARISDHHKATESLEAMREMRESLESSLAVARDRQLSMPV